MTKKIFARPEILTDTKFSYCSGCDHGIAQRLVAEAIRDLGIQDKTFAVWSVGCSVLSYNFFKLGSVLSSHGRAPAVATGLSRALRLQNPEAIVFTYQGDGDIASIGAGELELAASRGENITVIMINNGVYGMTSGQMSPTTVVGQKTTTTQKGRDPHRHGHPVRVCEKLATLESPAYIARVALIDPKHIIKAGKAIKKALELQMKGKGFSFVEVLSACPINWGISPKDCSDWIKENMIPVFPLGEFRTPADEKQGEEQCMKN